MVVVGVEAPDGEVEGGGSEILLGISVLAGWAALRTRFYIIHHLVRKISYFLSEGN